MKLTEQHISNIIREVLTEHYSYSYIDRKKIQSLVRMYKYRKGMNNITKEDFLKNELPKILDTKRITLTTDEMAVLNISIQRIDRLSPKPEKPLPVTNHTIVDENIDWFDYFDFLLNPKISPLYKGETSPMKILFIQLLVKAIKNDNNTLYNPTDNKKYYPYILQNLLKHFNKTDATPEEQHKVYMNMLKMNSTLFSYKSKSNKVIYNNTFNSTINDYVNWKKHQKGNINGEIKSMFRKLSENKLVDRLVNNVLNEMKGDNLHQFIDYIFHYGKEGNLISNLTKNEVWDMLCKASKRFDIYLQRELDEEFSDWLHYNYDMDLDDIETDFDNLQEQYWDEFIDSISEDLCGNIYQKLQFNENNLIYIERNITIPYFSKNTNAFNKLQQEFDGHLGEYWSYMYGQVIDGRPGNEISLKGYVKPEDVDWNTTASLNFSIPDEYELRLHYNIPILLTEITAVTRNRSREIPIWKGNLIFQT